MKIAFVAITNLNILNALAIKMEYFPNDECDLFVCHASGISKTMLSTISNSGLMSHVYPISNADTERNVHQQRWGIKKVAVFLRQHMDGLKVVQRFIDALVLPQYDYIIAAYLSSTLLPVLWAITKKSSRAHIQFYEEGNFVYGRGISALTKTISVAPESKKKHMLRACFEYPYLRLLRKKIKKIIYLHLPNYPFDSLKGYSIKPIPPFTACDPDNHVFGSLTSYVDTEQLSGYNVAPAIFITQALYGEPASLRARYSQSIVSCLSFFGSQRMILKMHPSAGFHTTHDYMYLDDYTYVDRTNFYPLEFLFHEIEDMDHRVLISSLSAALLNPKLMFDKEPYLVFLFQMFEFDSLEAYSNMKKTVDSLRETYREPSKVICVQNMFELRGVLYEIEKREKALANGEKYQMLIPCDALNSVPHEQYLLEKETEEYIERMRGGIAIDNDETDSPLAASSVAEQIETMLSHLQLTVEVVPGEAGFSAHFDKRKSGKDDKNMGTKYGSEGENGSIVEIETNDDLPSVTDYWRDRDTKQMLHEMRSMDLGISD